MDSFINNKESDVMIEVFNTNGNKDKSKFEFSELTKKMKLLNVCSNREEKCDSNNNKSCANDDENDGDDDDDNEILVANESDLEDDDLDDEQEEEEQELVDLIFDSETDTMNKLIDNTTISTNNNIKVSLFLNILF